MEDGLNAIGGTKVLANFRSSQYGGHIMVHIIWAILYGLNVSHSLLPDSNTFIRTIFRLFFLNTQHEGSTMGHNISLESALNPREAQVETQVHLVQHFDTPFFIEYRDV